MYPTLKDGELYFVRRFSYVPSSGDIVLIRLPFERDYIVKRVIAVGGDTVKIDYDENRVYVNNQVITEQYLNFEPEDPIQEGIATNVSELTVDPGYIFVMGDNRNYSEDSRSLTIGQIAETDIIGVLIKNQE